MTDTKPTPTLSATSLTPAQVMESRNQSADRRLKKLEHAIAFINNHTYAYGARFCPEGTEGWEAAGKEPFRLMDDTPARVQDALADALVEAARYAGDYFSGRDE